MAAKLHCQSHHNVPAGISRKFPAIQNHLRQQPQLRAHQLNHKTRRHAVSHLHPQISCSASLQTKQASHSASATAGQVLLTREAGKNGKLKAALEAKGISSYEMPLVHSADGPDRQQLPEELKLIWNWIVLTSPEAAAVFLEAWQSIGGPKVRVAVVGQGTAKVLEDFPGFDPKQIAFMPQKADGESLASSLPGEHSGMTVLYPASAKASTDVQDLLKARGFNCKMIRTYTTETVKHLTEEQQQAAAASQVVTFASPSAIKAWVSHCGDSAHQKPVACIGKTTGTAAKKLGLEHVFYPDSPGIAGFVDSIMDALAFGKG